MALAAGWAATQALAFAFESRILLAVAIAWLVPLPVAMARRAGVRFDPVDPIWLACAVFLFTYGLVPALELWRPEPFESVVGYLRFSPPHIYAASWLSGLAFIAFCAGSFGRAGRWVGASVGPRIPRVGPGQTAFAGALLTVVGALCVETTLTLVGASDYSMAQIVSGDLRNPSLTATSGRGYLLLGYLVLVLGLLCLLLALTWSARERPERRRLVAPAAAAICLLSAILFGVVLDSRQMVVVTFVGVAVVIHLAHRQIPLWAWGTAVVGAAAFSVASIALRSDGLRLDPVEWSGYAAKTFDSFNHTVIALPRIDHFVWGRGLWDDLWLTYLPRALDSGKPTVFGIVEAQRTIVGTVPSGTYPPGFIAEGYLNFGVLGALLLPLVAGLLLRVVYEWSRVGGSAFALMLLAYLLSNQTGVIRGFGPVLPALVVVSVLLLPLLLPLPRRMRRARVWGLGLAGGALALLVAVPVLVSPVVARPATAAPAPLVGRIAPPIDGAPPARGRVAVVLFWASWCPECTAQLRRVEEAAAGREVGVVGVGYQDTHATARAAMLRVGAAWPTVLDDGAVARRYGLSALPSTVVVDPRGRVACVFSGPVTADDLTGGIRRARERRVC